jgi:hypothetical protein
MKDLQANYERVHSFLKKEEASVKSLEERAKQLGDLNEKYLSRSSEDPPPVEATSPLKSVQQGLDQAVKVVTTEKERSMKEKIADTTEQIILHPTKEAREKLSKKLEESLGPSIVTKAAVGVSKAAYNAGRKTGFVEEDPLLELGFSAHEARVKLVEEASSLVKAPARNLRKYMKNLGVEN